MAVRQRWSALVVALTVAAGMVAAAAPAAAATGVTVTGAGSGRCLDAEGRSSRTGTAVIIWDCHGGSNQRWNLTPAGELRVFDDAVCLGATGSAAENGGRPTIAACDGSGGQQWTQGTSSTIVHRASGLCLDVAQAATVNRSAVILWSCHGNPNQRWTFRSRADRTAPSVPGTPAASNLTCRSVTLGWAASTDNVGVTAYDIYHDGQLVRTVSGSTRQATVNVAEGTTWGWYVNARDAAKNVSQASTTLRVTAPRCVTDTTAPTAPSGVRASADGTTVTVSWTASTDAVGVTAYRVLRNDTEVAGTVGGSVTSFADSGRSAGTTYNYKVVALDGAGNRSADSTTVSVTTAAACSTPVCGTTVITQDNDIPWGLVTLPDGSVLYSRRDALQIVRLDATTGAQTTLGAVPDATGTDGEGGVMGLAIAADFSSNPWLYVMHSTATDNRVVRMRYTAGTLDTSSTQVLLSGIPRNKFHNGGRLRFGPDGMLYVATGDAQNGDYAQALSGTGALAGKILRMTPTGGVPADNPYAGSYVWSYGHRNPQGLAFDAQGRLWEQEFGNSVMDETNLIVKGGNYGWPQCEGTSGSGCGNAGLIAPKLTYPTSEGSCSGLAIVASAVYVACARGQRLYRAEISGDSLANVQQYFVGTFGRLRTVEPAPGGDLWLTTTNSDGNSILRVDLR